MLGKEDPQPSQGSCQLRLNRCVGSFQNKGDLANRHLVVKAKRNESPLLTSQLLKSLVELVAFEFAGIGSCR